MAISQAMCTSFKAEVLDEQHDLVADTIKIALFTSSASLGASTTAYSTSNEVANGNGYATGGVELTSRAVSTSGTTAYFDAADPSWTSATFTANGALIYNSSNSNKAIAVLAFGGDFTVAGGTFQIVFPAAGANAIIRID
jgi:hypothetical protein|tara:strand:+ start:1794 stop:2213 length:420 start_codon:yes stop_codon:yes gene_type:complete